MWTGKAAGRLSVQHRDRQLGKTLTCDRARDLQSERGCLGSSADPVFRRDFPRRRRADKDLVFGVDHGRLCIGGKQRIAGEPPDQRMGIEQQSHPLLTPAIELVLR